MTFVAVVDLDLTLRAPIRPLHDDDLASLGSR